MIKYLSLAQVLLIAEEVTLVPVETLLRVSRIDLLESAILAPATELIGLDPYPTLSDKTAALAFHIARNHPLPDGNKRLAFLSAYEFLWINGFDLVFDIDEAEKIFVSLAAGEVSIKELAEWISKNTKSLE